MKCPKCGKEYTRGMAMEQFKRIEEISHYNSNYYIGLNNDLLYANSDDDDTTEWWIISGLNKIYLGESYTGEGDILHRYEKPHC